jgi:hypothetical protein
MSPNVLLEIAELQDKTVSQLVQRYEQVFEEECLDFQTRPIKGRIVVFAG